MTLQITAPPVQTCTGGPAITTAVLQDGPVPVTLTVTKDEHYGHDPMHLDNAYLYTETDRDDFCVGLFTIACLTVTAGAISVTACGLPYGKMRRDPQPLDAAYYMSQTMPGDSMPVVAVLLAELAQHLATTATVERALTAEESA